MPMLAYFMGIPLVHTDHSNPANNLLEHLMLSCIQKLLFAQSETTINVSHTNRKHTVLRNLHNPHKAYVIPNAIMCSSFRPDPS